MSLRVIIGKIVVSVLLAFYIQSCESTIEFKGGITDPKIVLYSIFEPDSLVTVNIGKSYPITDYKYQPVQITDAVVKLYLDGEFIETLCYVAPVQEGTDFPPVLSKYTSRFVTPQNGGIYRLEADVPGLRTVVGETSFPERVPILMVDTSIIEKDYSFPGMPWVKMLEKIKVEDPSGMINYYMLQIYSTKGIYGGGVYDTPYNPSQSVHVVDAETSFDSSDEPLLSPDRGEDQFGLYPYNSFNIFNDDLISGKQYDLKIKVDFTLPDTNYYEFIYFQVQLHSVTRDLFLYLESYSAHMQTRNQIFSEPVVVYSNVENGLGIVGARITSFDTVKIGRYPVSGVNYRYDD